MNDTKTQICAMVLGGIPLLISVFFVLGWGYCSSGICPDNSFQTYLSAGAGLTFVLGVAISLMYSSLIILFSVLTIVEQTRCIP